MGVRPGHTCEPTRHNSLLDRPEDIACVPVAAVELRLTVLHVQLVCFLDLLPVRLVLLLGQLPLKMEEAVEHAGNLEQEDVEGCLHCNLHHEGTLRRVLSVKISPVD